MDSLPNAMRPFVQSLEEQPNLSRDDIVAIVFTMRLGDAMQSVAFLTPMIRSFVAQISKELHANMDVTFEVSAVNWSWKQGTLSARHRINSATDCKGMQVFSKIGNAVLDGTITPEEGLQQIADFDKNKNKGWEACYRTYPGKVLPIPLLASTGSVLCFLGSWVDFGFALLCGTVAGLTSWVCHSEPRIASLHQLLVSIFVAMLAMMAITVVPESTCFAAITLGTLFWYFYGIAFIISLIEIAMNMPMIGISRFVGVIYNSFVLAFGVVLGVWLSAYGSEYRFEIIMDDCDQGVNKLWYILMMPLLGIGAMLQFQVAHQHWIICLLVQIVAYASQYALGEVWNKPVYISNTIPTTLSVLAAHFAILLGQKFKLSDLKASSYVNVMQPLDYGLSIIASEAQSLGSEFKDTSSEDTKDACLEADPESAKVTSLLSSHSMFKFRDSGWSYDRDDSGYAPENERLRLQSDLWFCLMPALYILVPESKVTQAIFYAILSATDASATAEFVASTDFVSGVYTIALSQVIGLKVGFVLLWLLYELFGCGSPVTCKTTIKFCYSTSS